MATFSNKTGDLDSIDYDPDPTVTNYYGSNKFNAKNTELYLKPFAANTIY